MDGSGLRPRLVPAPVPLSHLAISERTEVLWLMFKVLTGLSSFYRVILDLYSAHFDEREWPACTALHCSLHSRYFSIYIQNYVYLQIVSW